MIAELNEKIVTHLGLQNYPCIYASGSYIHGYAHATSDIDIFLVADEYEGHEPTGYNLDVTVPPPPEIHIHYVDGTRVDIEVWTSHQINDLVTRAATREGRRGLSHGDMEFLWRMTTGLALVGDSVFSELKSGIEPDTLVRQFVQRSTYSAEARLDDAAGLLEDGQLLMAAISTRDAFARVVDAVLNANGYPGPPSKWRTRKLSECVNLTELWDQYVQIETMDGYSSETGHEWVERAVLIGRKWLADVGNITD